ncbi:hypothetical protein ABGB07_02110 [Micromonosporaceae bacterium B7E4]
MSLTTDVMDRLTELGDSANEIAEALEDKGITGVPQSDCACPIAVYLSSDFGAVQVGDEVITIQELRIPTPAAVTEFIYAFDQEEFPELISDPEVES